MTTLTLEQIAELHRLVQSVYTAKSHDTMPTERELADACLSLLAALAEAQAGEAYERNRADTLVEENAYFVEEAEMFGKLIYRAIEALGKEWREETDDDGEKILLGAIAELLADRDRLAKQVEAMRSAIRDHLNRPDYWDGLRKVLDAAALASAESEGK